MAGNGKQARLRFGAFVLDASAGELWSDGRPVKIQPQPLKVLALLAQRAGEVVSREELQEQVWNRATFVEFDQGLNYCIRQIRVALLDEATNPVYLETVKKRGYRFIAPVTAEEDAAESGAQVEPQPQPPTPGPPDSGWRPLVWAAAVAVAIGLSGWLSWRSVNARHSPATLPRDLQPITDFSDSAVAPALSPDGRMVAFIRGNNDFLTADQIYVKMLPNGEARQLTDDPRPKYGPAFSPDGSEVAYTAISQLGWVTYAVPVLGGDPRLVMQNAAGLTWLDRNHLLFSRVKSGLHMGIVTAAGTGDELRELYFPPHERAMAHYSYASPDRKSALVVEMDKTGQWEPCRLIALEASDAVESRIVGPPGRCTSAAWSPDGRWMFFAVYRGTQSHLWRQPADGGPPEQITFGPTSEAGIAVAPDGRSLVTSSGLNESTLWIHERGRDRQLSSEGHVYAGLFSQDGRFLYYQRRLDSEGDRVELRRMSIEDGKSDVVFPGVSVRQFDISSDGLEAVYMTAGSGEPPRLWIAPLDRSAPPRSIGEPGDTSPFFGPDGDILFRFSDGTANYLGRMHRDGSGRVKAAPTPVVDIHAVSPGRNWVLGDVYLTDRTTVVPGAIPVRDGNPVKLCDHPCSMAWATSGRFLFLSVEDETLSGPGRSLAVPVGPGETLPPLPAAGVGASTDAKALPGVRSVGRAAVIPGPDPDTFAYVLTSGHRNLFRVTLP